MQFILSEKDPDPHKVVSETQQITLGTSKAKKDWTLVFFKTFYCCSRAQDFIFTHFSFSGRRDFRTKAFESNIQVVKKSKK